MYVDGVRFEYKSNPYEHAKSLGSPEGKANCQFMVAMTLNEGVVLCVPLSKRISGEYFAQIVKKDVKDELVRSKKKSKRILQDGDPSQNSKKAKDELFRQNIRLCGIPARSPGLNLIKNLFNQVRRKIKEDSLA